MRNAAAERVVRQQTAEGRLTRRYTLAVPVLIEWVTATHRKGLRRRVVVPGDRTFLFLAIIVVAILYSTLRYAFQAVLHPEEEDRYQRLKFTLGRALLLGLEILVAADIVRTVALEATLESVVVLGLLVLIRTFLSWALVVEIEGHWPWHARRDREQPEERDL